MDILKCFQDGFIFASGEFIMHQGAYTSTPERPTLCDKCQSTSGDFHAHGRFKRRLITLRNWTTTKIQIWKQRWLCLCCDRTMSTGPPDTLPYIPYCTMIIMALLWSYLNGNNGIHNSIPVQFDDAPSPRTLERYLHRAKAICEETKQTIEEVLSKIKRSKPWDKLFSKGLSPPERLNGLHRDPDKSVILWQVLAMLLASSDAHLDTPCLLMARVIAKNQNRISRFLL